MCGIFGVSRITDITWRMLPHLAWEMENRGRDSWGCTDGTEIIKRLGPITHSWQEEIEKVYQWPWAIFHTRAASTGDKTIENQHPFVFEHEGKKVLGIHNGIVWNHEELNLKYDRKFDVDTQHIFAAIAGMSPTTEVGGYGNLAWFETDKEHSVPRLCLLRFNSDNLHIARLKSGEVVFASTPEPILRSSRMAGGQIDKIWSMDSEYKYVVDCEKDNDEFDTLYKGEQMKFGTRNGSFSGDTQADLNWYGRGRQYHDLRRRQNSNTGTTFDPLPQRPQNGKRPNISSIGERDRTDNICLRSCCTNKVARTRKREVLCPTCFLSVIDGLNLESREARL